MAGVAGPTHNAATRTDRKAIVVLGITSSPSMIDDLGIDPAYEWAVLRRVPPFSGGRGDS
jgi:hypothetical protein